MRTLIIILSLISITTASIAQESTDKPAKKSRTELIGPAAKNAKPWEVATKNIIVTQAPNTQIVGPVAKNTPPKDLRSGSKAQITVGKKKKLMGPAAKNSRP